MTGLITVMVHLADPSDLAAFGVRVTTLDAEPRFRVSDGVVWKSACWICVYDDDRMLVQPYSHLTARELRVIYGLAEAAFTGGLAKCRAEKWERCRRNKSRSVGYYRRHFYVRADMTDPYAQVVAAATGLDNQDVEASEALGIDSRMNAGVES